MKIELSVKSQTESIIKSMFFLSNHFCMRHLATPKCVMHFHNKPILYMLLPQEHTKKLPFHWFTFIQHLKLVYNPQHTSANSRPSKFMLSFRFVLTTTTQYYTTSLRTVLKLQRIQNQAARILTKTRRRDHITRDSY